MTWIQTGTLASAHFWKTTSWQSTLTFMKGFFWINEQPLCSLSEVFLIIWTLFSLHATLYQKFIQLFSRSPFARLVRAHSYSPLHVCIYLCFTEVIRETLSRVFVTTLTRCSCQAAAASWCGWRSSWRGVRTRPWTWRLARRWLCPRCWFERWSRPSWPHTERSEPPGAPRSRCWGERQLSKEKKERKKKMRIIRINFSIKIRTNRWFIVNSIS